MSSDDGVEIQITLDPTTIAWLDRAIQDGVLGSRDQAVGLALSLLRRIRERDRQLIPWCFAGAQLKEVSYQIGDEPGL